MFPPHSPHYKPHFTFEPAFWLTAIVSSVAIVLSLKLGGRVDDITLTRGHVAGEALH
jgi:hypothetical protein